LVDERLVAWGQPESTLAQVLASLGHGSELITCIAGQGAPLASDRVATLAPDAVELEHRDGGQPSYWWLLSAE
jgi:hypothetical protein